MAISPLCEARHGAGAFVPISGTSFVVTPGETLEVRLVDTAGVNHWELECVAADDSSAQLVITRPEPQTLLASIEIPAGAGRAWLLRSRVNHGVRDGAHDATLSCQFKLSAPTAEGLEVGALGETTEAGSSGWLGILNAAVRAVGLGGGGGGAPADAVPEARQVLTGDGLQGGGDLSQDRSLSLLLAAASGLEFDAGALRLALGQGLQLIGNLLALRVSNGLVLGGAGAAIRLALSKSRLEFIGGGLAVKGQTLVFQQVIYSDNIDLENTNEVFSVDLGNLEAGDIIDYTFNASSSGGGMGNGRVRIINPANSNTVFDSSDFGGWLSNGPTVTESNQFLNDLAGQRVIAVQRMSGDDPDKAILTIKVFR